MFVFQFNENVCCVRATKKQLHRKNKQRIFQSINDQFLSFDIFGIEFRDLFEFMVKDLGSSNTENVNLKGF